MKLNNNSTKRTDYIKVTVTVNVIIKCMCTCAYIIIRTQTISYFLVVPRIGNHYTNSITQNEIH